MSEHPRQCAPPERACSLRQVSSTASRTKSVMVETPLRFNSYYHWMASSLEIRNDLKTTRGDQRKEPILHHLN